MKKTLSVVLSLLSASALAAPPRAPEPISLTVSGGVSLGAYQAGYIYYLGELFRLNSSHFKIKEATGASSGSINAFLSLLAACSPSDAAPKESPLWNAWMPIGFKALLGTPESRKASAIFSTEALDATAERLRALWEKGLNSKCDVVLGVTTTLLTPEQLRLRDGVEAVHQEQDFVLRIRGQGAGKPPLVTNYLDPKERTPRAMLYLPEDARGRFDAVRDLLLASAAFPGAFPPRKLLFCETDRETPLTQCERRDAREANFTDGGVYENEPVRLAIRTAARGLESSAKRFSWTPEPRLDRLYPPREMGFYALDVTVKGYPEGKHRPRTEDTPFLELGQDLFKNFVTTTRSQGLYSVLIEYPDLPNSITASRLSLPPTGSSALSFAGFLDRGFREFDFALGMYDARKTFLQAHGSHFTLPENRIPGDWSALNCFRAELDHEKRFDALCQDPSLANQKILLELALDRISHPRDPDEDETASMLRYLSESGYVFENGKHDIRSDLRAETYDALTSLADRQPPETRAALRLAGEPAVNFIVYEPPKREVHFLLGDLVEIGGSAAISRYFRAHLALTMHRPTDVFTDYTGEFSLAPLAGFELDPPGLSNALFQPRLGTRVGWQLTPRDHWGGQACLATNPDDGCTRWAVEPYLSLSVYERLRLQFVERFLPPSRGQLASWDSFLQLGLELTP